MTLSLLLVTPRKRLRIWHSFTPFTCLVVRDGSRIRFWLDSWVLHILALFSQLFNLSFNCNGPVSDFILPTSTLAD